MRTFKIALLLLFVLITLTACSSGHMLSQKQISRLSNSICVVYITDNDLNLISNGSGWFARNATKDVRIYTAYHVIEEAQKEDRLIIIGLYCLQERDVVFRYLGEIAGYEPDPVDLASIRITKQIDLTSLRRFQDISQSEVNKRHRKDCLNIGFRRRPREMEQVFAVGFPGRGLIGQVLQYHRAEVSGYTQKDGYMLLNVMGSFSGGLSGGPILDKRGKTVVGVVHAVTRVPRGEASLVVPITFLDRLYNDESALLAYYTARDTARPEETPTVEEPTTIPSGRRLSELLIKNDTGQQVNLLFIVPRDTKQLGIEVLGGTNVLAIDDTHKLYVSHPGTSNLFHIMAISETNEVFVLPNTEIRDSDVNILAINQNHKQDGFSQFFKNPDSRTITSIENMLNTSISYLFISPSESSMWGADILGTKILSSGDSLRYILFYSGATVFDVEAIDSMERSYRTRISLGGEDEYALKITETMMRRE